MTDDEIPMGKPVELTADNPLVSILIRAQRSGWTKRQFTKLAALAAAYASGWFAQHGGQEYAPEIGMGIAAVIIFVGEAAFSWIAFKFSQVSTVQALTMDRPETRADMHAAVRELSVKQSAGPPVVTVPSAIVLLCLLLPSCRACPQQYNPRVEALPAGANYKSPPAWFGPVNQAIIEAEWKRQHPTQ